MGATTADAQDEGQEETEFAQADTVKGDTMIQRDQRRRESTDFLSRNLKFNTILG